MQVQWTIMIINIWYSYLFEIPTKIRSVSAPIENCSICTTKRLRGLTDDELLGRRWHDDGGDECHNRDRAEHMPGAVIHGGSAGPHPRQNRRELAKRSACLSAPRRAYIERVHPPRGSLLLHRRAAVRNFCRQTWAAVRTARLRQ